MKQLEDQEKLWLQSGSVKQGMESSRTGKIDIGTKAEWG